MSADDKADAAWNDYIDQQQEEKIEELERELNAANERIKCLIEERDRANRLADWKWSLRGEFESLLGTDNIEKGIKAVKEMKQRIKRLEEAGDDLHDGWRGNRENKDKYLWAWLKAKEPKL